MYNDASSPSLVDEKLGRILDMMRSTSSSAAPTNKNTSSRMKSSNVSHGRESGRVANRSLERRMAGSVRYNPSMRASTELVAPRPSVSRNIGFLQQEEEEDVDGPARSSAPSTARKQRRNAADDEERNAPGDTIGNLHHRIDDLLGLRKEINRREREKEHVLKKMREKLEVQDRDLEKIEAALSKAKEVLKEKDNLASGIHERLRETEKTLKRVHDDNEAATEMVTKLNNRLQKINDTNKELQHEIQLINGKIGSLGNDVESHLRDRR